MASVAKKKIPLPESFFQESTLNVQTKEYWNLTLAWNGRANRDITINDAILSINNTFAELNPQRMLAQKLMTIKDDIVMFGTKKRKLKNKPIAHTPNTNDQKIVVL